MGENKKNPKVPIQEGIEGKPCAGSEIPRNRNNTPPPPPPRKK